MRARSTFWCIEHFRSNSTEGAKSQRMAQTIHISTRQHTSACARLFTSDLDSTLHSQKEITSKDFLTGLEISAPRERTPVLTVQNDEKWPWIFTSEFGNAPQNLGSDGVLEHELHIGCLSSLQEVLRLKCERIHCTDPELRLNTEAPLQ